MQQQPGLWHALFICLGASIGALLRWRLSLWLNHPNAALPWGTLLANLLGGYLIGVTIGVLQTQPQLDPAWRALLVTGFLGALTTFSTFSAETLGLLLQQRYFLALSLAALHLVGSLLMTWLGLHSLRL